MLCGAPFVGMLTFKNNSNSQVTSIGIFTYTACRWQDAVVQAPALSDLCSAKDAPVDGQFMPFEKNDHVTDGHLHWSGRFGTGLRFPTTTVSFVDLKVDNSGRWLVSVETLNMFLQGVDRIKECPVLAADPYPGVNHCDTRVPKGSRICLFCDTAVRLRDMMKHVAVHIIQGDQLTVGNGKGDAE